MWAFAVYNQKYGWVELWKKMPVFDAELQEWIGDGYMDYWVFPEVPMEVLVYVRKHGPLLVSIGLSFGFWASGSVVELLMKNVPECFNGQKVNNV